MKLLFSLLLIAVLGVVFFMFGGKYLSRINDPERLMQSNCVEAMIPSNFLTLGKITNNLDNSAFRGVLWKREASEPFIVYPAVTDYEIDFAESRSQVSDILQRDVIQKFDDDGYIKNPNAPAKVWGFGDLSYDVYEYEKGGWIYNILLGDESDDSTYGDIDPTASEIMISCGKIDPELSSVYDQIQIAMKEYNKPYLDAEGVNTNIVHTKGFEANSKAVYVNSKSFFGAGAYSLLVKTDKGLKRIFSGQDHPFCDVLIKNNAGAGLECWESTDSTTTTFTK